MTSPWCATSASRAPVGTWILGVLWAGWHLPVPNRLGTRERRGEPEQHPLVRALLPLAQRLHHLGLQQDQGSLPLAMLVHASNNNFSSVMLFTVFTTVNLYGLILSWAGVVGFGAVALVLVAATRGRLGYRPELLDDEPERNLVAFPPPRRGRRGRRSGGTGSVMADHKVIWTEKGRTRKLVPIFWHPHRPFS